MNFRKLTSTFLDDYENLDDYMQKLIKMAEDDSKVGFFSVLFFVLHLQVYD